MKGNKIIDLILRNGLQEFDIKITTGSYDLDSKDHRKTHEIIGIGDIGHSDKITKFETEEIET